MKKIAFLFLICGLIFGQDNKTVYQLPSLTTVASDDYIPIWDNSTMTYNKITYSNLIGTAFSSSSDYTWTGANNFTGTLQVPSTLSSSLSNGIGYSGGLFGWTKGDSVKTAADRAWVISQIEANLLDTTIVIDGGDTTIYVGIGDTTQYAKLAADQTFTGTNNFTARVGIGSSVNNGAIKMPVYTLTNRPDAVTGSAFYHSTSNKFYIYEGGWIPFLDSTAVASLMTTGSYLPQSGTGTGYSSTLTWSSGTITPYKLSFGASSSNNSMIAPMDDYATIGKSVELGSWFYDNAADRLYFYNGSSWNKFEDANYIDTQDALKLTKTDLADSLNAQTQFFSSTVVYPSNDENIVLFRAPFELEVDSVHAVVSGTASCSSKVNIEWGDVRTTADAALFYGDQWVSSTSGEAMTGDVYSSVIYQGEWVWFKTSGLVGTVYDINLTITYHRR